MRRVVPSVSLPGALANLAALADPEHQMHKLYTQVEDKIAGACRFCAIRLRSSVGGQRSGAGRCR